MQQFKKFLFAVYLLSLTFLGFGQAYQIKVKINGLRDTTLILGHYLNKSMYPDDSIRVDKKGTGVFKGNKKLPEGLYLVYLPSSRYFEIIMGDNQKFSIDADTADFLKTLAFKGSLENQVFIDFQRYMVALRKQADSITTIIKAATEESDKEKFTRELRKINEDRITRINQIGKDYPNLFVAEFLKATLDINVPEPPKNDKGEIIDSSWQYRYYRDHYFDNFNISDPKLLRTPLYEDKIMNYITKVIPQIPDSLISQVDMLIDKSRADSSLFRFMLITLFNYFGKSNIMGMDAVQVHIADKYYINDAWWSDAKFIKDLKERVEKTKPLLIGKIAPDMTLMLVPSEHFVAAASDTTLKRFPHVGVQFTMHSIQAKYLVLVFWEADCGHCKIAVPELYDDYERSLKNNGVKVLAVSTLFGEDGKVKWVDFVNEHKLYNWLNAWNPYSYDFKITYDISTTPQIYILDENKKIIAKRISPDQVEEIINSLIKK